MTDVTSPEVPMADEHREVDFDVVVESALRGVRRALEARESEQFDSDRDPFGLGLGTILVGLVMQPLDLSFRSAARVAGELPDAGDRS